MDSAKKLEIASKINEVLVSELEKCGVDDHANPSTGTSILLAALQVRLFPYQHFVSIQSVK